MITADYGLRYAHGNARAAIVLLADVHAPAREWAAEHGYPPDIDADRCFTLGYLRGTIEGLLDALGYPEHGPSLNQVSWLVEDDDDDPEQEPF